MKRKPYGFETTGRRQRRSWLGASLAMLLSLVLTARAQTHPGDPPGRLIPLCDEADNTFQAAPVLPSDLRRLVVLPVAWEGGAADLSAGAETVRPILLAELIKTKEFEIVTADPRELREHTGRSNWTGAEVLPADFFGYLQREYGCDAILFCELTDFRANAPLAVGWRMKLVEARTRRILWAVDELVDAEQAGVLSRACLYHDGVPWVFQNAESNWQIEHSPRLFAQYTIARSLSTLPERKDRAKVSVADTDEPSRRQTSKTLSPKRKTYGN